MVWWCVWGVGGDERQWHWPRLTQSARTANVPFRKNLAVYGIRSVMALTPDRARIAGQSAWVLPSTDSEPPGSVCGGRSRNSWCAIETLGSGMVGCALRRGNKMGG